MVTGEDGLDRLQRELDEMGERARGWTDTAPRVHDFLLTRQRELWETQGASEAKPWPGLPPKWAALKKALGVDPRPLRWEPGVRERLFPSLTDPRHRLHVFEVVNREEVRFGTAVPYASRHDQGQGKNPFGETIRERPLATLSDRNQLRLGQLLAVYIARGARNDNVWDR